LTSQLTLVPTVLTVLLWLHEHDAFMLTSSVSRLLHVADGSSDGEEVSTIPELIMGLDLVAENEVGALSVIVPGPLCPARLTICVVYPSSADALPFVQIKISGRHGRFVDPVHRVPVCV
jgi:hypothetical protein